VAAYAETLHGELLAALSESAARADQLVALSLAQAQCAEARRAAERELLAVKAAAAAAAAQARGAQDASVAREVMEPQRRAWTDLATRHQQEMLRAHAASEAAAGRVLALHAALATACAERDALRERERQAPTGSLSESHAALGQIQAQWQLVSRQLHEARARLSSRDAALLDCQRELESLRDAMAGWLAAGPVQALALSSPTPRAAVVGIVALARLEPSREADIELAHELERELRETVASQRNQLRELKLKLCRVEAACAEALAGQAQQQARAADAERALAAARTGKTDRLLLLITK
jgi:hypothetical protein